MDINKCYVNLLKGKLFFLLERLSVMGFWFLDFKG